MKRYLSINKLRFTAPFGVFEEEWKTQNELVISLVFSLPADAQFEADELNETLDYTAVCACIEQTLEKPFKTIEYITEKIAARLAEVFPLFTLEELSVEKVRPPVSYDVKSVSIHFRK